LHFLRIFKFIPISRNIIKNRKSENRTHSNGPALAHDFGLLAQPGREISPQHQCCVCAERGHRTRFTHAAVRWRACRRRGGGGPVTRCSYRALGDVGGGIRQVHGGAGSPMRPDDGEAEEGSGRRRFGAPSRR
jgi:hypothetical protein